MSHGHNANPPLQPPHQPWFTSQNVPANAFPPSNVVYPGSSAMPARQPSHLLAQPTTVPAQTAQAQGHYTRPTGRRYAPVDPFRRRRGAQADSVPRPTPGRMQPPVTVVQPPAPVQAIPFSSRPKYDNVSIHAPSPPPPQPVIISQPAQGLPYTTIIPGTVIVSRPVSERSSRSRGRERQISRSRSRRSSRGRSYRRHREDVCIRYSISRSRSSRRRPSLSSSPARSGPRVRAPLSISPARSRRERQSRSISRTSSRCRERCRYRRSPSRHRSRSPSRGGSRYCCRSWSRSRSSRRSRSPRRDWAEESRPWYPARPRSRSRSRSRSRPPPMVVTMPPPRSDVSWVTDKVPFARPDSERGTADSVPPTGPCYIPDIPPLPYPTASNWNLPPPATVSSPRETWYTRLADLTADVFQEIYLGILLGLPRMYFSRVSKIFTDADLYQSELEEMYRVSDKDMLDEEIFSKYQPNTQPANYNVVHLLRFKSTWEEFINGMITEWQVQNVVGVLLLSAVLTLLQIDDISGDPLSRTTAIFSLVFALTALLHGCAFMARFGSMKKLYKAAVWAEEAQRTKTSIIWNVWVFLALPTVWLSWSIITFIVTVLSYVWRAGANEEHTPLSSHHVLIIRIIITLTFLVGFAYFGLALRTLSRYGSVLDAQWEVKVEEWKQLPTYIPVTVRSSTPRIRTPCRTPVPIVIRAPPTAIPAVREVKPTSLASPIKLSIKEGAKGPYETFLASLATPYVAFAPSRTFRLPSKERLTDTDAQYSFRITNYSDVEDFHLHVDLPQNYHFDKSDWTLFLEDLLAAWKGTLRVPNVFPEDLIPLRDMVVNEVIQVWNDNYFGIRNLSLVLDEDSVFDPAMRTIKILSTILQQDSAAPPQYHSLAPLRGPSRSTERTESVRTPCVSSRSNYQPLPIPPPQPIIIQMPSPNTEQLSPPTRTPHLPTTRQSTRRSRIVVQVHLSPDGPHPPGVARKLPLPEELADFDVLVEEWDRFIAALDYDTRNKYALEEWNTVFFGPRQLSCSLEEKGTSQPILVIKCKSVAR